MPKISQCTVLVTISYPFSNLMLGIKQDKTKGAVTASAVDVVKKRKMAK